MAFQYPPDLQAGNAPDDAFSPSSDTSEYTVLYAMRAWLRPHCDAHQRNENWCTVLTDAGVSRDGLEHFQMLMRTLLYMARRPLDTRCRCASELAYDEGLLLQTLGLLQATRAEAATQLLNLWLPSAAISGVLKTARWFAFALLDAGLEIRVRDRQVSYMH